jgi:Ca2+-binding EF-hand superfamily protein
MALPPGYDINGPPKPKDNNYMRETEKYDQIVYFFDYVDDVFQKDIPKAFQDLMDDANKIPEEDPSRFEDPYTAEKLLYYFSHGAEGRDPIKGTGKGVVIDPKRITQYKKDFDPDLWSKSFSAAKISAIIKTFGWGSIPPQPYFFKMLIDKFDFDGDGRLSTKEFLFYAIWENYKNYYSCRKHCFKEVIESLINPLFTFFDCDSDGYINSENLWEGNKYLKRKDPEAYNYYRCEVPKTFNKYYRTHAPNDFILKNFDLADGYLNREEFRKGILLGYWERQVNEMGIVNDDSINRKSDRWGNEGKVDIDCQELLSMYDKLQ